MPRPTKIVQLGLEQIALKGREKGWTKPRIVAECQKDLAKRGSPETVTERALARYYDTLDKATVPAAHAPQVAEANAALAIEFGKQFHDLNQTIRAWLDDVNGRTYFTLDKEGNTVELAPDWDARVKVATALQRNLDSYADLMERIHNADQIKAFREEVLRAISEESADCARRIEQRLVARQSLRQAALTGSMALPASPPHPAQ